MAGFGSLFLDLDPESGIGAGAEWERTLYAKLRQCHAVVVVLSPAWIASKWCFAEAVQAREKGKSLFPVVMKTCELPSILADFQSVNFLDNRDEAITRLLAGLEAIGLGPKDGPAPDPSPPPYPGMMAFDDTQAGLFFGRDDEIRALRENLESLRRHGALAPRLVLALGASGSGKSSLVRAGLLPRLRVDKTKWIIVPPFRPLGDPFGELAAALERAWRRLTPDVETAVLDNLLSGNPTTRAQTLVSAATALRRSSDAAEATVLLTIDQAEELLTPAASTGSADFLVVLRAALETAGQQLMAVATLRSDFLGAFQTQGAIKETTAGGDFAYVPFTVEQMPTRRFPEIIRGPARVVGLELEDGLVEQLVADAEVPDALPILAFTLQQLYERFGKDAHRITLADYETLGRLEGSVRGEADRIIRTLSPSPAEVEALRAAFVPRLAQVGADGAYTRRRALKTNMPEQAERLLNAYVDAHLLVTDQDREGKRTIEITHEALLRVWPLLRGWLDEDRARLQLLASIQQAATEWRSSGGAEELLVHRKGRLTDAMELHRDDRFRLPVGSDERAYLDACAAREARQERRARRIRLTVLGATAAVAVVFAVLAGLAYTQREAAIAQRDETLRAESRRSVILAANARARGDLTEAIELARVALAGDAKDRRPPYSYEAAASLFDALAPYRHLAGVVARPADIHLSYLDGGARLLGAGKNVWWIADAETGEVKTEKPHSANRGFVVSADRGTAVSVGQQVKVWNLLTGGEIPFDPDQHLRRFRPQSADLSSDGRFLVVGTEQGAVLSFALADGGRAPGGPVTFPRGVTQYVHKVLLSPDAGRLVAIQSDTLWIHSYDAGRIGTAISPGIAIKGGTALSGIHALSPVFLGQSSLLLVPTNDRTILVNVADGEIVRDYAKPWRAVVASLVIDGVARVRRLEKGIHIPGHSLTDMARDLEAAYREYSPAGATPWSTRVGQSRIATTDLDGLAVTGWPLGVVADTDGDHMAALGAAYGTRLYQTDVKTAVFLQDSQRAATGNAKRTLLWRFDGTGGRILFTLSTAAVCGQSVVDAVCTPDGAIILTSQGQSRQPLQACIWNSQSGKMTQLPDVTYGIPKPGFLTSDGKRAVIKLGRRGKIGVFDTDTGDPVVDEALAAAAERRIGVAMAVTSAQTSTANGGVSVENGLISFPGDAEDGPVSWRPPGLVTDIALNSATNAMAATRSATAIEVWDAASGRLLDRINDPGAHCVTFSPEGALRAVVKSGAFVEWNVSPGDPEEKLLALSRLASP